MHPQIDPDNDLSTVLLNTIAQSEVTTDVFPFMKLPAELRHMVYRHVLYGTGNGGRIYISYDSHLSSFKNRLNAPFNPALVTVSRQIFSESVQYLYMNDLRFPSLGCLQQFLMKTMVYVPHLKSVSIDATYRWAASVSTSPFAILGTARSLQKLELVYRTWRPNPEKLLEWLRSKHRLQSMTEVLGILGRSRGGQPTDAVDVLCFSFCRGGCEGGDLCETCQLGTQQVRKVLKEEWQKDLLRARLLRSR